MKKEIKLDKGQAGLTVFLSLVATLFVIGLIIMIFSLMSGEMKNYVYDKTTASVNNETVTSLNKTVGNDLTASAYRNAICSVLVVHNATSGVVVPSSNYTVTGCNIRGEANSLYLNKPVNVTYSYVWDKDNEATDVINDTVDSLSGSTQWFDIFLVIGAMLVLIILIVIVILAIRSSGLTGSGENSNNNSVGTA